MSEIIEKSIPTKLSKRQLSLIETSIEVYHTPPKNDEKAFMAKQLVQATLPHNNPGDVSIWTRSNGKYHLSIQPGIEKGKSLGLPYGTIPRLLMFWLTREAIRTQSREIKLGSTLSEFLEEIGLGNHGGKRGDITRLKEQMKRLLRSRISFDYDDDISSKWMSMEIAPRGEIWWQTKNPNQSALFESWIELGEGFFDAITSAPVPLDTRALKELKNSSLALDLYAWCAYTSFQAKTNGKTRTIPWKLLHEQFGSDYKDIKEFARKSKQALKKIVLVYPKLHIQFPRGAVSILPTSNTTMELTSPKKEKKITPKLKTHTRHQTNIRAAQKLNIVLKNVTFQQANDMIAENKLSQPSQHKWDIHQIEKQFYEYVISKNTAVSHPDKAFLKFVEKKIQQALL